MITKISSKRSLHIGKRSKKWNRTRKVYNIKGIEDITINDDCIVFYCKGKGIAPSSQEYGFYYSKNNLPIAIFDGKAVHYFERDIAIGEGCEYVDDWYNSFYTEKIIECFYYYENSL